MPTTLGPESICSVALAKIGCEAITSLLDTTNRSSRVCNTVWPLAYLKVIRSARWNCLLTPSTQLAAIQQTPLPGTNLDNGNNPVNAVPWAEFTSYQANSFVTYGNYFYQVLVTYTSSANFLNDVTSGYLAQTDQQSTQPVSDLVLDSWYGGCPYPSGWNFQYQLPDDFQLLGVLNGNVCWDWDGGGGNGDQYEIMGTSIYCNQRVAVIQYVQSTIDTTRFDSLLTDALTNCVASMIATALKQDGGKLEAEMNALYKVTLSEARAKNGGEGMPRRFNPVRSSRLVRSRFWWNGGGGGDGVAQ